jgi:putative hemolysin
LACESPSAIAADLLGPTNHARDDVSLQIDGSYPSDRFAELIGIPLPLQRAYQTIAGFALDKMRHLPETGEFFLHGLWRFEIIDVDE